MIEFFRSPRRGFSHPMPPDAAIVSSSRRLVLLSGAQSGGSDPALKDLGGIAEQVRGALHEIELTLTDLGGALSDIARAVVYVRTNDSAEMDEAWETYVEVMGDPQPTATLIGVALLGGGKEYLIEIEATAVLP